MVADNNAVLKDPSKSPEQAGTEPKPCAPVLTSQNAANPPPPTAPKPVMPESVVKKPLGEHKLAPSAKAVISVDKENAHL